MNFYPEQTCNSNPFYFNFFINPQFANTSVHQVNALQSQPFYQPFYYSPFSLEKHSPQMTLFHSNNQEKALGGLLSRRAGNNAEINSAKTKPMKSQKKDGNLKANVIKDFVKSIKKDGATALMAKLNLNLDYPLKKFIEHLSTNFPAEQKYIRFKKMVHLCTKHEDPEFSLLLRTLFYNFLKGQYQILVLSKKKNKKEYLKVCRQMANKLIEIKK